MPTTPHIERHFMATATVRDVVIGGLIPLAPYILLHDLSLALWVSVGLTLTALLMFGYVKAHFTGLNPLRGAVQTVLIGGLAAAAAFAIARLIG